MQNRIAPGAVLTAGLCLVTAAFGLWAVQATALDRGPLHRNAERVLSASPVQEAMTVRLTRALATTRSPGAAMNAPTIAIVATRALEQPEFVAAFAGALDNVQAHVVEGATGPITLDPALVSQAVRAVGAADPQLAPAGAVTAPLVIEVPTDELPDLAQWADAWKAALRAFLFFALLLITYGVLRSEHRAWALGRIGRWAIVVGVSTLAVFWLLPRLVLRPLGGWIAVGGAVAGAGDVVVQVAFVLIGVGAIAVFGAHRWEAHDRRRVLSVIPRSPTRSATGAESWESPV